MFHAGEHAIRARGILALKTTHLSRGHSGTEKRIFARALNDAPPARVARDINHRREGPTDAGGSRLTGRDLLHLLDECGIFAGISSGAVLAGVDKMAATMDAGTIVALVPDGGWKYLSSGAWTDDLDVVTERAQRINYW